MTKMHFKNCQLLLICHPPDLNVLTSSGFLQFWGDIIIPNIIHYQLVLVCKT